MQEVSPPIVATRIQTDDEDLVNFVQYLVQLVVTENVLKRHEIMLITMYSQSPWRFSSNLFGFFLDLAARKSETLVVLPEYELIVGYGGLLPNSFLVIGEV